MTPHKPEMNGIGYLRVSTRKQALGSGLERQRESINEYAQHHNINLLTVYEDVCSGVSEWYERDGLRAAVHDCETRDAVLLFERWDRLSRKYPFEKLPISFISVEDSGDARDDIKSSLLSDFLDDETIAQVQTHALLHGRNVEDFLAGYTYMAMQLADGLARLGSGLRSQ